MICHILTNESRLLFERVRVSCNMLNFDRINVRDWRKIISCENNKNITEVSFACWYIHISSHFKITRAIHLFFFGVMVTQSAGINEDGRENKDEWILDRPRYHWSWSEYDQQVTSLRRGRRGSGQLDFKAGNPLDFLQNRISHLYWCNVILPRVN